VDAEDLGSIVMFHVLPQQQLCRTWAGRAPDGTITRVVSDLGLLHVDPKAHPDDPLQPGSPPPEPSYERVFSPSEHEAGVASGERWRAAGGADGDTVTVLEVMRAEHSWLIEDPVGLVPLGRQPRGRRPPGRRVPAEVRASLTCRAVTDARRRGRPRDD
jgi:hypothetical protein